YLHRRLDCELLRRREHWLNSDDSADAVSSIATGRPTRCSKGQHLPARLSKAERHKFLSGRHVAVLVTNGADGTPLPSPIWYAFRDGKFYFRTAGDAVKLDNVRRDPRVSVCVQDERPPYKAVIAYGPGEIAEAADGRARDVPR